MRPPARSSLMRIARAPADLVVGALVVVTEILRPLYRPLYRALARLALIRRAEAAIARSPPYLVLVLLAIPFLGVEPLKVLALIWLAEGRVVPGLLLLAGAYLASFVLVERVYRAGREQLFEIGWFAALMGFVTGLREAILTRVRALAVTRAVRRAVARARVRLARLLRRHPGG